MKSQRLRAGGIRRILLKIWRIVALRAGFPAIDFGLAPVDLREVATRARELALISYAHPRRSTDVVLTFVTPAEERP
jgi:hypothetical protein